MTVNEEDDNLLAKLDDPDSQYPWYMISKTKSIMVTWELLFSLIIMYNMITVPLMLCFPWTNENPSRN